MVLPETSVTGKGVVRPLWSHASKPQCSDHRHRLTACCADYGTLRKHDFISALRKATVGPGVALASLDVQCTLALRHQPAREYLGSLLPAAVAWRRFAFGYFVLNSLLAFGDVLDFLKPISCNIISGLVPFVPPTPGSPE